MLENEIFGYVDDNDKSLESKVNNAKFGLNNAIVLDISINTNAGRDNTPLFAVDTVFMIKDTEMRLRLFNVERVFSGGKEILDKNSEEYKKAYIDSMKQVTAVLTHIVKSVGVTDEAIKAKFAKPAPNFETWCQMMLSLLPADYKGKQVDLFLEYQWNISPNKEMTYLEVPRTMKGGRFLCPHINPIGDWIEQTEWINEKGQTEKGLRYVDNANNVHPFTRTQSYMESNRAIQQKEESASEVLNQMNGSQAAATW